MDLIGKKSARTHTHNPHTGASARASQRLHTSENSESNENFVFHFTLPFHAHISVSFVQIIYSRSLNRLLVSFGLFIFIFNYNLIPIFSRSSQYRYTFVFGLICAFWFPCNVAVRDALKISFWNQNTVIENNLCNMCVCIGYEWDEYSKEHVRCMTRPICL